MSLLSLLKAAQSASSKGALTPAAIKNLQNIHLKKGEKPSRDVVEKLTNEVNKSNVKVKKKKINTKSEKPVMTTNKKIVKKKKKTGGPNKNNQAPTQTKGVIANKFKVTEGAYKDPVSGGSVNIGRQVGTKNEKVTGVNKPGARGNNFLKDQETAATRKRAALTVELEQKKKKGTLTPKEKVKLSNINKTDRESYRRQTNQTLQAKQRRNDAAKKREKKPKVDDVAHFTQTGEIRTGFNPTSNQIKVAIRNAEARKDTPAVRKLKAKQQALETTKPGKTAIKSYNGNTGKPKVNLNESKNNKPREFKNRAEERKAGGKVVKRDMGGSIGPMNNSKQDMRKERKRKMTAAAKLKYGSSYKGKVKKDIDKVINKKSARTRNETINKAEKMIKNNPKMFSGRPSSILTKEGFEKVNRKRKAGGKVIEKKFGRKIMSSVAKKVIGGPGGALPKKRKSKKLEGTKLPIKKKMAGGSLKDMPAGNKGLPMLPTVTRNKMGYKKAGGMVKKMGGGQVLKYGKGTGSKTIKGNMDGNGYVAGCYDKS